MNIKHLLDLALISETVCSGGSPVLFFQGDAF